MLKHRLKEYIHRDTLLKAMENVGKDIGINTTGRETPEG